MRLPGRLRRRLPAAAGRRLPRPRALRAHVLQPGPDVRARHRPGGRRHGLVHRGRRLRAGDVGPGDHRQGHRHDLPGRPAAGEGRHRRGRQRGGAGRRRRAHAAVGGGRLPGGRRRARARPGALGAVSQPRGAAADPRSRAARGSALRPAGAAGHRAGRSAQVVRRARGHRAAGRRLAARRVQGALRRHARRRLRARARDARGHPGQQRRPVLRVGAQGHPLHPALQPAQGAADLPAEHHRLHGRPGLRAAGHREGRGEDGARGRQHAGAEADRHHRRLVRRRQLRHVRARLRSAAAVDLAERPHLRDGRRAGGRRPGDGQARPGAARGTRAVETAEVEAIRAPILDKYEREGSPYYATARLWDDGILDPLRTRAALALGLAAAGNAPIADASFGVFRM